MNIQITSDNIKVSDSMKTLAVEKLEKITNKLTDIPEDLIEIRVVLNKGDAEGTFVSKVELTLAGKTIFGSDSEYTLESSLIKAIEDTLRQYEKEKDKSDSSAWQARRDQKAFHFDDNVVEE